MIVHNFDPVLIDFGIIQIRWYSLAYILGILLGWWYGKIILKKQIAPSNHDAYLLKFDDLIGYLIIGIIVGGRLGYVLFYDFSFYLDNILEILKIWKGGMSFHGGFVGVAISAYIFSRKKNLNYKIYFDTISCVAPIGIFLGRIANFINGELYGIPTQKPWGVVFPNVDSISRHPSQIYEALLEGILLFLMLNLLIFFKRSYSGLVSSLFLIFYGFFRIICEQFREPDSHIGYILNYFTLGSILSIIMIMFGFLFLSKILHDEKNR